MTWEWHLQGALMVWKGTCMPTEVSPKRYLYLSVYQRIVMASWKQLEKTHISTGVSDCQWLLVLAITYNSVPK